MPAMSLPTTPMNELILNQLAQGEKRVLTLTVAVRKSLGTNERIKGNLADIVKASLQKLIASKAVVEVDGTYTLASTKSPTP